MTDRQEAPDAATSRPQSAEQGSGGPPITEPRERVADGHTEPRTIRQLRAERDLLARTVAVYTMRSAADVLAETREALGWTEAPDA